MPGSERVRRRIELLLDEADAALARNDWRTALERAKAALAHDPENADARHYREAAERGMAEAAPPAGPEPPQGASPRPAPPHPSSFASGRYTVKKFLGEGGKKKVYLAHDTVLDRDVAFALIKTEGLDEAARARVLREAQVMGRLGDHPHIMPIYDLGQEKTETGTQPYMVLPLMPGGDVDGLIEHAREGRALNSPKGRTRTRTTDPVPGSVEGTEPAREDGPGLPLERVMEIAVAVSKGLTFAHSHGIIHRDLKPGNVWLAADGTAKIGDFGLALAMEQTRLTQAGMMVGTVAYMPPEQALGSEITPKADLYSLGCMLYEMVTGRPPFPGDDHVAIIGQHINTPPVAPAWHRPACPKPLGALIMRLLAKDPVQRPDSAADVLSALQALDLSAIPSPERGEGDLRSGEGLSGESRSLDSMSSGVFVGRHREMEQLRAALEETLSGHGRMVTLIGEPGIGKTRTAGELATYAGLRRCQVLWGRCYEGGGAPPYWPWVQAIRQFVQERDADRLRLDMGSSASVIAEIVQDVKEKLSGIHVPPQLENPESARFRLFDSIASFLKNASRTQPVVLVLDDLHWSDSPSLLLLEFVARELANSRILLVGTYRDVELNRRHPLAVTLGDLTKDRLFERVILRGLQKQDIGNFIELAAAVKPPPGLVEAVHTQTEGNPLFVTEVVRLLVQEGHLGPERTQATPSTGSGSRGKGKTTSWIVRVPEGVREVIGRRLNRLTQHCNEVLTTASVIGRQFSLQQMLAVLNDPSAPPDDRTSEDRLFEILEEALAARVIEELPSAVGQYQFTHALIQETLTNELSTTRRVRLHARIAQALENIYGEQADAHASELVRHFSEAETSLGSERLARYCIAAGEQSLKAYAPSDARGYFERGLSAESRAVGDSQRADLFFGLARAQVSLLGRHELQTAFDNFRRAFDLYIKAGHTDRAVAVAASHIPSIHGPTGKADLIERALPLVKAPTRERGMLLAAYGLWVSHERGDYETSQSAFDEALSISKALDDQGVEMRVHSNATSVHGWNLNPEATLVSATRALELLGRIDDPGARISPHFMAAGVYLGRGDPQKALEHSEMCVEPARRSRSAFQLTSAMSGLANVHAHLGDFDRAREYVKEGLEAVPTEVRLLAASATIECLTGHQDRALRAVDAAVELVNSPGGLGVLAEMYVVSGEAHRLDLAEENARRMLATPGREPLALVGSHRALCLLAIGRHDPFAAAQTEHDLLQISNKQHQSIVMPSEWILGVLAWLCGRRDDAAMRLQGELEFAARAGYRPRIAYASEYLAEILADGDERDRARSPTLRDQALAIAREIGLRPLTERIIARKKILKA